MSLAIHADQIVDGTGREPIRDGFVIVEDTHIRAVGPTREVSPPRDANIIEFEGTLLPGLVNAHTHCSIVPGLGNQIEQLRDDPLPKALRAVANMRREFLSGVTTARVLGEEHHLDLELRRAIELGIVPGPRLLCAGVQLTASHGHGLALTSTDGVDDVRLRVRQNLAAGADWIKMFVSGGASSVGASLDAESFTAEEIRAACEEAHRAGLKVAAHAHGGPGVRVALAEGVDSIEHGLLLELDDLNYMKELGRPLVCTLSILTHPDGIERTDRDVPEIWAKVLELRKGLEKWFENVLTSGVSYCVGTDAMHGLIRFEMATLVKLGASPMDALQAGTSWAAEVCGLSDTVGTLEAGKLADVIGVEGDPLDDIECVAKVGLLMKAGQRFEHLSRD